MSAGNDGIVLGAPNASSIGVNTVPRISMPEHLDWHMILDQELSQLLRPETGVVASLGFVGVGATLGLLPQVAVVWERLGVEIISTGDAWVLLAFAGSSVLGLGGLALAYLSWRRNKGLADEIRKRPKFWSGPDDGVPGD